MGKASLTLLRLGRCSRAQVLRDRILEALTEVLTPEGVKQTYSGVEAHKKGAFLVSIPCNFNIWHE